MNNELMQNEDFIRCSTMIAELLMKYKAMEDKDAEESGMQKEASRSPILCRLLKCLLPLSMLYRSDMLWPVRYFDFFNKRALGGLLLEGSIHFAFRYCNYIRL